MALMGLCCAGQRVLRWGGRLDCQAGRGGSSGVLGICGRAETPWGAPSQNCKVGGLQVSGKKNCQNSCVHVCVGVFMCKYRLLCQHVCCLPMHACVHACVHACMHEQSLVYWGALAFDHEPSVEGTCNRDWPVPLPPSYATLPCSAPSCPPRHRLCWLLALSQHDQHPLDKGRGGPVPAQFQPASFGGPLRPSPQSFVKSQWIQITGFHMHSSICYCQGDLHC